MKIIYLVPLLLFAAVPAFANIGFTPVYQPNGGSGPGIGSIHDIANVTETGCALNEILQVNATGFWDCGTNGSGGNMTVLNDGGDVTITAPSYLSVLFYNGLQWIDKIFSVNTLSPANDVFVTGINNQTGAITTNQFSVNTTDCGTSFVQKINNVTGEVTCTAVAGGGNMTKLDDAADVVLTTPAYLSTLFYNGIVWIDKIFTVNSVTCGVGQFVNVINNQTGATSCGTPSAGTNALLDGSAHSDTVAQTVSRGSIIYGDATPKWNELTVGASGKVLTSDGTDISWQTPSSGSGIPMPPKKWGELIPRSASADTLGLVSGCTILATASYVYDTTDNSNAILSTTATTDGINGGIHCTGTNYNSFRGDQNAYLYSKWEENKITTNRIFIGFTSSATHLPNNADTILDNLSGVGLCIRTSDTVYQMCRNDGDATTDYATLTTSEDTGVHYVEVYTTDSGVTWCVKLDGGTAVCHTTEIPATTTQMYAMSTGETDGGASAILWTQYLFYVQSDK